MLLNISLKANEWANIDRQGRFLNVVLAAGEIDVRVRSVEKGGNLATKLVAGMSPEELKLFESVQFKSEVNQTVKVWIAMTPLTFSPDTIRNVGSSAVTSSVGRSFSNTPSILFPAKIGRNNITITPSTNILVGDSGINLLNGIPVAAGQQFNFNTQGAVYSFTQNNNFPATIGVEIDQQNIDQRENVTSGETQPRKFYSDELRKEFFSVSIGGSNSLLITRYDYDQNFIGQLGIPQARYTSSNADMYFYRFGRTMEYLGFSPPVGNIRVNTLDLDAYSYTDQLVDFGETTNVIGYLAANATRRVIFGENHNKIAVSDDGITWTVTEHVNLNYGTFNGLAVGPDGRIYIAGSNSTIWISDTDGLNFISRSIGSAASTSSRRAITVDQVTNRIWVYAPVGFLYSDDLGVNWFGTVGASGGEGSTTTVDIYAFDNLAIAQSVTHLAIAKDDNTLLYTENDWGANNTGVGQGIEVSQDGRVIISGFNRVTKITGDRALGGGAPVALLEEIN